MQGFPYFFYPEEEYTTFTHLSGNKPCHIAKTDDSGVKKKKKDSPSRSRPVGSNRETYITICKIDSQWEFSI